MLSVFSFTIIDLSAFSSCSLTAVVKLLFLFVWFVLSFIVYFIMYDYSINQVLCSSLLCSCVVCCYPECIHVYPHTRIYMYIYKHRCIHFPRTIASVPQCIFHLNGEYLKIMKWNFNLWRNRCKPYGNADDADSVAREPVKKLLFFFVLHSGSQTLQADWNKPIKSQTEKSMKRNSIIHAKQMLFW